MLRQMDCRLGFQGALFDRQRAFGLAAGTLMQLPDVDQQGAMQGAGTGVGGRDVVAAHVAIVAQTQQLRCAVVPTTRTHLAVDERRVMIVAR
ncbi:hypothetical protein XAP7430_1200044 [Xanthomonas phaseoli pv. phaseoli]|uniref:Uncharacterized protein n=1 Tax=Xanthomonas campestris pv. phaseoli TaxID=317013 RepID=A0AB38DVB6_XANCH|nr:hypothetical protein XAP6984_1230044 [Xanthomonas phaseoli pv. phaseoli]SON81864.1 hypothetical protein XAP7430_1200044 [Xanthomonas phaseoli pv. phaseoli]